MRNRLFIITLSILIFFVSSCRTLGPNLALDLQGEQVPVMLNEIPPGLAGIENSFTSGEHYVSMSSSSGDGASATARIIGPINKPIYIQLNPILSMTPQYLYIKDIAFTESYKSWYFIGLIEEKTKLLIKTIIIK